jgi:hypothetical protein
LLLAAAALAMAGATAIAASNAPLGQSLTGESCRLDGSAIVCGSEPAGSLPRRATRRDGAG